MLCVVAKGYNGFHLTTIILGSENMEMDIIFILQLYTVSVFLFQRYWTPDSFEKLTVYDGTIKSVILLGCKKLRISTEMLKKKSNKQGHLG